MDNAKIDQVFDTMAEGMSLNKSCMAVGVPRGTFLSWIDADVGLIDRYTRARGLMLDANAEALEDLGDQAVQATDAVQVAGLRLKCDNRKWLLSKLASSKYGDKLDLSGALTIKKVTEISDDDLANIATRRS